MMIIDQTIYYTIEFPSKMWVYQINFDDKGFTKSTQIFTRDSKECNISRYLPGIRTTVALCYNDKDKQVIIKRIGNSGSNSPNIVIDYEPLKIELSNYRMVLMSSASD